MSAVGTDPEQPNQPDSDGMSAPAIPISHWDAPPAPAEHASEQYSGNAAFATKVYTLQLDALMKASRAREYALEWLFGGLACGVIYLLLIVIPRASFQLIDVIVIGATVGGGMVMQRYEWGRRQDLIELADRLHQATRPR